MVADADNSPEEPGGEPEPASYDRWFRSKVHEAMTSERARIPHDEAIERVSALLLENRNARFKPR